MNEATSKFAYIPKKCVFEVTLACNIKCRHCGSRAGDARPDELSTDEIADIMKQLADLGCIKVTISGGEALMRPDWQKIIKASSKTGMLTGLITNGILFTSETARRAKDAGLDAVAFSLDGIGPLHDRIRACPGLFERTLMAMDCARNAKIPFFSITQINRANLTSLREIRDLLIERGAHAWQVQPSIAMGELCSNPEMSIRPSDLVSISNTVSGLISDNVIPIHVGDTLGYFHRDEAVLRRHAGVSRFPGCLAGTKVVGIESNGDVKGCLSIQPGLNDKRCEFVEGNLRERSLASIWHDPDAFAYNRKWSLDDLVGFCRNCRHAVYCRGGCRSNLVASGDGVDNPMCVYRVLSESQPRTRVASAAAAVVLASLLGSTSHGCQSVSQLPDASTDSDSDTDTDTDTDSDTDTDTDTDTDIDSDTDSDIDAGEDDGGGVPVYDFAFNETHLDRSENFKPKA